MYSKWYWHMSPRDNWSRLLNKRYHYDNRSSDERGFLVMSSIDNVFCSFFCTSSYFACEDFMSTSRGSILVSFVCIFFVVSRKRFLYIFARKGSNHSSETLKKATTRNGMMTHIAMTVATHLLPPVFTTVFRVINPTQLHIATITNCTKETDRGPIWKFILNQPFSIFLGTKTFMLWIC